MTEPSKDALRMREARRAAGIKPRGPTRTREMNAARIRERRASACHERSQGTVCHERSQEAEAEEFIELVDEVTGKIVRCRKFVAPAVNPEWPLLFTNGLRERRADVEPTLMAA